MKFVLLIIAVVSLIFSNVFPMKAQLENVTNAATQDSLAVKESNIIDFVEVMPQFPGGDKALLTWLVSNIRYPEEAIKNKIEGRVTMRFLVKSDGSIGDVAVLKGLYPACDSEAVRVVKMMPNWIPGTQNGKPVNIYYTVPILFKLPPEHSTEVMPQFPGGDRALLNFLIKNMRYPDEAQKNNIQGKVHISFIVKEDGSIENIVVTQGVDPSLDKEAVRMVKKMPKWIPGTKDGKPIPINYSLPITFRMTSSYIR